MAGNTPMRPTAPAGAVPRAAIWHAQRVIATVGAGLLAAITLVLASCTSLAQAGTTLGVMTGTLNEAQAASINQSAQAVQKSWEDITPEQEYYIGRAVAATILSEYKVYDDKAATDYINLVGQSLAMASDLPETYSGYHFLILDSNEINALSAPSGFIFITRGLLRMAKSESGLAGILAHEIGHVEHHDGIQAIKKSRITAALTSVAITGAAVAGSPELQQLTQTFGESVKDVTNTLINNGYSRQFEEREDQAAVVIMERVGYDPWAYVDDLAAMEKVLKQGGPGFAKTHPSPELRIKVVEAQIGAVKRTPVNPVREARFEAAMKGV